MTEISFHFNVPEPTSYACRLVRKAVRQRAALVVTGPEQVLVELDRALWNFDPLEFIPHLMLQADEPIAERLRATPVWLTRTPTLAPCHDVLIHLGGDDAAAPQGFESFTRLVEIVSSDAAERIAARQRWKHYAARGYLIEQHDMGA